MLRDAVAKLGPYVLYETLGSGGMGTVYRAELHVAGGLRRMVALKQLHPHLARMPDMVALFANEARLGAFVRHANVVQTFDFGRAGEDYFIAMEYVPGPTLAQVARLCASSACPMPFPIVLGVVIQLCDALDHVHNVRDQRGELLGIVHRDVSPTNVIVSSTGIVKLVDFGISKAESSLVHTQTGLLRGKLGYIAPEYLYGRLDARADLFGLGVIAYELLTNRPLFLGLNEFDTLTRLREMPIPSLSLRNPHVPRELDEVVMKALQREPDLRWQTAGAMKAALSGVARSMQVPVGPSHILEWSKQAVSQGAEPDPARPDDVRARVARPDLDSAGQPVPILPVHEISTIFVQGSSSGSAVTRVYDRDPPEPATGRFLSRTSGVPSVLPVAKTTKYRSARVPRDTRKMRVEAAPLARDRNRLPGTTASQRAHGKRQRDPLTSASRPAARSTVLSDPSAAPAKPGSLVSAGARAVAASAPATTMVDPRASTEAANKPATRPAHGPSTAPSVASSASSSAISRRPDDPALTAGAAGTRRASYTTSVVLVAASNTSNHPVSTAMGPTTRQQTYRLHPPRGVLLSWPVMLLVLGIGGYLAAYVMLGR